jgi:hypothetical protein
MMMKSLRTQLSLSILLILTITIGLIGFFSNWFINREFEKYVAESERTRSENIVADLGNQYDGFRQSWNFDYVHIIGMYSLYDGYLLKLSDRSGNIVWDAENHDMSLCGQIMNEISARMEKRGETGEFIAHTYEVSRNGQKKSVAYGNRSAGICARR